MRRLFTSVQQRLGAGLYEYRDLLRWFRRLDGILGQEVLDPRSWGEAQGLLVDVMRAFDGVKESQRVRLDTLSMGAEPDDLDAERILKYRAILDDLPPILINPQRVILDGRHRVTAARAEGRGYISAVIVPL